ncbi:MAG: hypothetical protein JWM21_1687 [Acidobacteria bacterium]|nr:hypothetical protein [Acidobacteriota bacterium]
MIPPRPLKGVSFGNGVRYRVSACRRRLRYSRTTNRTHANIQQDGQSEEIESRATPDRDTSGAVLAGSGEEAEST